MRTEDNDFVKACSDYYWSKIQCAWFSARGKYAAGVAMTSSDLSLALAC